jgi:CubicO group peptidase (beta-lactamase class C family)
MRSLAAVALIVLTTACSAAPAPPPREPARPERPASPAPTAPLAPLPDPAPHIAAIERGLLPLVRIQGRDQRASIEARMRALHVPGLQIAVLEGDQLAWSRAYGVADADTGQRAGEATLFQAGSISKALTALAVLLAVDKGELGLDLPVNELLTSWKLPENDFTARAPVTLRHLLSHSAGTTVHGFPGYAAGKPIPSLTDVLDGKPPANTPPVRVDFLPGSRFRYSGGGTTVVQELLIDRFQRPFPTILRERVLAPLGLERSTFEQPLPPDRLADAAAGHDDAGKVIPGKRHVYPEMAAAGLSTTAADLARFLAEIDLAAAGRPARIPAPVARLMTTPAQSLGGGDHVGLGLFLRSKNGFVYFGHNGADAGFHARASARLGRGYGAVILANAERGMELIDEVERAIAVEYGWEGTDPPLVPATLSPEALARRSGTFATGLVRPFTLTVKGGSLELARPFATPIELVPLSEDTFVGLDDGTRYRVTESEVSFTKKDGSEKAARLAPGPRPPLLEIEAGDHDKALASLRALLKADPKSPAASEERLDSLGTDLYFRRHDRARGLLVLRLATELYPGSVHTYASLARAYEGEGDTQRALATYRAGLAALARDKRLSPEKKKAIEAAANRQMDKLRGKPSPP